jgi:hypothetical protein
VNRPQQNYTFIGKRARLLIIGTRGLESCCRR